MILGAPLGPVRRVWAGEFAAPLGARHAAVQDQVGVAVPHADPHGVDAGQQARLGPARQMPAQDRATGLLGHGGQAAPRRARAQQPAQGGRHAKGCGGRVTTPAMTRPPTRVDHRCDEMQNPDVQGRCSCLSLQTWAAAEQAGRSGISTRGNCENRLSTSHLASDRR